MAGKKPPTTKKKGASKRLDVSAALEAQSKKLAKIDARIRALQSALGGSIHTRQIFPGYIVLINRATKLEVGQVLARRVVEGASEKIVEHWFLYQQTDLTGEAPFEKYTYPGSVPEVTLTFLKKTNLDLDLDKPADLKKFVNEHLLTKNCDYQRAESVNKPMPTP